MRGWSGRATLIWCPFSPTFCGGAHTDGSYQLQISPLPSSLADSEQRLTRGPAGVSSGLPCRQLAVSTKQAPKTQLPSPAGLRPVLKPALSKPQLPQQAAHRTLPTFPQLKLAQHGCPRCVPCVPSVIRQGSPPQQTSLRKICGHQATPQHACSWNKQTMRPSPPLIPCTLLLLTKQTAIHK